MLQWSWVIGPLKVLIHVGLEMHEAQKTGVITDLISCASIQHQVAFESLHVAHCRNKHMVFRNIQLLEASANGVHREAANLFFFKSQNYPARLCLNLVLGKNSGGQRTHKLGNVVLLSETVKISF